MQKNKTLFNNLKNIFSSYVNISLLILFILLLTSFFTINDLYYWYFYNKWVSYPLTLLAFFIFSFIKELKQNGAILKKIKCFLASSFKFYIYSFFVAFLFYHIEALFHSKNVELIKENVHFNNYEKKYGKGSDIIFYSKYGEFSISPLVKVLYDVNSTGNIITLTSDFKTYQKNYFCNKKLTVCFLLK